MLNLTYQPFCFFRLSRGIAVLLGLLLLIVVPVTYAANYIYDNTTSSAFINPGCAAPRFMNVPDSFIISDLNLGVNIDMAPLQNRGVVSMTLQSPAGTLVKVMLEDAGNVNTDFSVLLDDNVSSILTLNDGDDDVIPVTAPYFSRSARPSNPLSAFNGQNANGNWIITVCAAISNAGADGDLIRSSLQFTSVSAVGGTAEYVAVDAAKGYAGWLLVGASSLAVVIGVVGGLWVWRQR